MMTALLLLPVLGVATWLYWYLLPGRSWKRIDTAMLAAVIALAWIFVAQVESRNWTDAGPMWAQIVSAAGAYAILILGLTVGLFLRRR